MNGTGGALGGKDVPEAMNLALAQQNSNTTNFERADSFSLGRMNSSPNGANKNDRMNVT